MMRLFCVALLALGLAGPARATQDQWPATFDVVDVAADDVLNVRAAPSATAPIIGMLAHDATGVEVIRPNDRQSWGLVNMGESTGWVSLRFLARAPGQWLGQFPYIRNCFGTEPFWSLAISASGDVDYATPEGGQPGAIIGTFPAEGRRDTHAMSIRLDDGPLQDALGIVRLASCNDGMSDREFGIALDLVLGSTGGERLLTGCCSLAP